MKKTNKSYLVVVDMTKPVGLITERDIVRRVVAENVDPTTITVSMVMSSPIISVNPDDTVSDVAKLLEDRGIRRVLVMKKGLVMGGVTSKEFVKAIVTEGGKDVEFLRSIIRSSTSRY